MSKNSGPKYQTTTTSNGIPGWVEQGAQSNWNLAQQIANKPMQEYKGELVAGFTPDQLASQGLVRGLQGTGEAMMAPIMDLTRSIAGTSAPTVSARSFLSGMGDIQKYMDPYLQTVEAGAMDNLDRQRLQALNQTGDQAASAGAFGGSRHGVMEGVTNAETARNAGQLSAQIRSSAWNDAAGRLTGDIDRELDVSKTNAAAFLDTLRNRLAASELLSNQAGQSRQLTAQEIALLDTVGQQQQGLNQARDDANYGQYMRRVQYPIDMLNLRTSTLSGSPYPTSSSTTSPVTRQNNLLNALGGAATGASIAKTLGATSGWGAALTGVGGLLGGLSEDTAKTDVSKVGKDPDTGLDLYAYRYKGDPKSYPKVVGPMASQIEKKVPGGVKRVGGKRVVVGKGLPVMAKAVQHAGLLGGING